MAGRKLDLERLEIEKAANGGITVRHHFKPKVSSHRGMLGMEHMEPEVHSFGPKEHHLVTAHITKALGLKNQAEEAAEAAAEGGGQGQPEMAGMQAGAQSGA